MRSLRRFIARTDRTTLVCAWIVLGIIVPFGLHQDSLRSANNNLERGGEKIVYYAVITGCQRGNITRQGAAEAINKLDRSGSRFEQGRLDGALVKLAPYDCRHEAAVAVQRFRAGSK